MYLKPNQMHEYLTPVMEIVSVDPNFIYRSPLSIRLFENNLSTSSGVSGSECSESDSESESAAVLELPLFDNSDEVSHQQKLRIDEQFDLAAYITGANTDFNYLQSPCHSESDDTNDYVGRWLNDCFNEDIPTEAIEAIVWSKQECDLNVLVKENSFEPNLDLKTASNSCDNLAPIKSICMNNPILNLPSKSVGIGQGKNLSMFINNNHDESFCDSASEKSMHDDPDTKTAIAHACEPMVNVADVLYPREIKEYKETSIVLPKLTLKAELQPVHSNGIEIPLNNLTEPTRQNAAIVKTEIKPWLNIPQEPELPCIQVTIDDTKPLTANISTSDSNDGNTQVAEAKEIQIKKKRRLNLDEYLKRRRGHKENCNVLTNRNLNDDLVSAIKIETTDTNAIAEDVKPNLDALNLEEIIIVSMGTNTEMSIPPNSQYQNDATNNSDLSHILKSNYLFDINDTIIKANGENVKISNNSLIASIQDVLLKKCKPNGIPFGSAISNGKTENGDVHGEDKTIMHLRKDRIRVATKSVDVQTDCLLMFPILRKSIDSGRSSMRDSTTKYSDSDRHRGRSIDNDHKRSCSPNSDSSLSSPQKSRRYGGSHSPAYSNNYNYYKKGSYKRKRNYGSRQDSSCRSDSDSSQSESSEKILQHSYSDVQTKYSFKNNIDQHSNHQRKNIEERRIVYVGRIEQNTTKDDLKMKFLAYGPIKQITLHHKENGMKFGFVTYENANDAYRAIDCSSGDATINMYDISFGGRRAFCKATYMDLDGTIASQSTFTKTAPPKSQPDSFEDLLKKMKDKLCQKRALESP